MDPTEPENNPHTEAPSPTKLQELLQAARVEYPPYSHKFFVPNCAKNDIVTENVVTSIISTRRPRISTEQAQEYAKAVCKGSRDLFAVLAYMEKGEEVCAFLDEGISDEDLPFERSKDPNRKCNFSLQLRNKKKIEAMEEWTPIQCEIFGKEQWLMLAPFFEDKKHYKLHSNMVLPFICTSDEQPENAKRSRGGYSEVFFTQIHNSHYWEHKVCTSLSLVQHVVTRNRLNTRTSPSKSFSPRMKTSSKMNAISSKDWAASQSHILILSHF